jgi:hypothetical protein
VTVTTKAPNTHLPSGPSPPSTTINVPVTAGQAPRTVPALMPGKRALTVLNSTVQIDPTVHTAENIISIINGSNQPNIVAFLDRYGQINITGVNSVSGDSSLLTHLGFQ